MRTLLTILAAGSLVAHITEDTSNLLQHVKFQSSNFENILTWDSGPESTPDTVYSVEYKEYGSKDWLAKEGCQRITQKSCNLTLETKNIKEEYYARVTALSPSNQSATKMTDRFNPKQHTTLKPPVVTCIPRVRSIQMIIHPILTPVLSEDGHQLTLEDIFTLCYHSELQPQLHYNHTNHTGKMYREGKKKEFEFTDLTPNTAFRGSVMISDPTMSKNSTPYMCKVKTLPDRTWSYSFSGIFLFSMGFLVAVLCYLSFRCFIKPPPPPNSLNFQGVLTFQPLHFFQEPIMILDFEVRGLDSPAQPELHSHTMVSRPKEPPRAPELHGPSEMAYLEQQDASGLQPPMVPPPQTMPPLSYAPQAATKVRPPTYTPPATPETEPLIYAPQAAKLQPPACSPQAPAASWPSSYGMFMEGSGKESRPGSPHDPKHLQSDGQFQKEAPSGHSSPCVTLKGVTSLAMEGLQDTDSFHPHLGICRDPNALPRGEPPGASGYLKDQLPLLSSVQIEGHPGSLPLHTPALKCSPTDQGPHPWGLLESLVCSEDENAVTETEAKSQVPGASEPEPQAELGTLFQGLALTVQWEP